MTIGSQIKFARLEAKLTQMELAQKTALSRSYIGDIEKDRYNPSISTLELIAKATNKPVDFFVGESSSGYYLDPETARLAQELHDNPDYKAMFDATRNLSPDAVKEVMNFIKFQKAKERGEADE